MTFVLTHSQQRWWGPGRGRQYNTCSTWIWTWDLHYYYQFFLFYQNIHKCHSYNSSLCNVWYYCSKASLFEIISRCTFYILKKRWTFANFEGQFSFFSSFSPHLFTWNQSFFKMRRHFWENCWPFDLTWSLMYNWYNLLQLCWIK